MGTAKGQKGQQKWINIWLQVSRHHLLGGVHRRDIKVPGGQVQGTSQGTITHPCYHLSHLWDRVLFNTPGLKIDSTQHPLHIQNNGLTQAISTNNNSPMATGISEHALNSEYMLRDA